MQATGKGIDPVEHTTLPVNIVRENASKRPAEIGARSGVGSVQ